MLAPIMTTSGFRRSAIGLVAAVVLQWSSTARAADTVERPQSTIKGMVVRQLDSGRLTGMAVGIIATAQSGDAAGRVEIRGQIGDDMRSALDEAVRYVRVAHPTLGKSAIAVSFEERYSPKDGGSAGTAFALLLRSLFEGYAIDPKVAITGDIAVNGTVQPIGGVAAKIRGAMADGCTLTLIPTQNAPAVADLMVKPQDRLEVLRGMQIFTVASVDDAVALVRADRADAVKESIALYGEVQETMKQYGVGTLSSKAIQDKLARILELTPGHVTAQHAADIGKGKSPRHYTRTASVIEIFSAARPFWVVVTSGKQRITRSDLPATTMATMMKDLTAIKAQTHPDVEGLRHAMHTWIDTVNRVLSANKPISPSDMAIIDRRAEALRTELKRLDADEALVEKMMREGY